jgi:threonine dehydratase
VSKAANTYLRSFAADQVVPTNSALTFADGMAVRVPDPTALEVIRKGAERIVEVTDDEIAEAIRPWAQSWSAWRQHNSSKPRLPRSKRARCRLPRLSG